MHLPDLATMRAAEMSFTKLNAQRLAEKDARGTKHDNPVKGPPPKFFYKLFDTISRPAGISITRSKQNAIALLQSAPKTGNYTHRSLENY